MDMLKIQLPTRKELLWCAILWSIYFLITAMFVGLRPDNTFLAILFITCFCYNSHTRHFASCMIPFVLFGLSYDWMRIYPNYMVNDIDVKAINDAERAIFGISTGEGILTPNEFFLLHKSVLADVLSGLCYLCWVPVPIAFGLYLFFTHRREHYTRFAWAFLLVNLIGFAGYYIHPAAPPWYVMKYGFEPVLNTPGDVAGLASFDALVGVNVFHGIYSENANIFAAVPSLHSAYVLIAAIYAFRSNVSSVISAGCLLITVGIWFAAVYTSHHYLIDVLLGISCALIGVALLEILNSRCSVVRSFFNAFARYIGA